MYIYVCVRVCVCVCVREGDSEIEVERERKEVCAYVSLRADACKRGLGLRRGGRRV